MNNRNVLTLILMLVSTIFLSGNVFGQAQPKKIDIAEISNNGTSISWQIKVPYESATLTVSTPSGEVFRKEFKAGTNPSFSPIGEKGEYYGSGRFNYEIVLAPILEPGVKEALAKSRIDGNGEEIAESFRKRGLIPEEMSKSGTFTFQNGNFITGNVFEKEAEKAVDKNDGETKAGSNTTTAKAGDFPVENAQTFATDLIVQGSTCSGFDCVSAESFGSDTLRLKENNLRIHFNDTSNSGSFPTRDWRIVANDTTNGGANYLAIEDSDAGTVPFRVLAGAGNNALYIDAQGDVGLNTSNPILELHIADGDSPGLRLEQTQASGFAAQAWDIAGNETNFFVRDVTNGSKIPFKIRPGAPTDSLVIESNGDVTFRNGLGGAASATYFFGGGGAVAPADIANASLDLNNNAIGPTSGIVANVNVRFNFPPSQNLLSNLSNVEYVIRYLDSDGTSNTNARIRLSVYSVDVNDGTFVSDQFFDSNNYAPTTTNTVTICKPVDVNFYSFATRGMFMTALLQNKTASGQTQLLHVRVRKVASCS